MRKRIPPYLHSDGSNCWTENCSRGNSAKQSRNTAPENISIDEMFGNSGKIKLDIMFSEESLKEHVDEQLVVRSVDPENKNIAIYKYSRSTQYRRAWDDITTACRGLIVDHESGSILARPFPKFFNYGELTEDEIREKAVGPMNVMEKLDGSLIIGYVDPAGTYRLTTGGGFQASQRTMAENIYNSRYAGKWTPRPNTTYMWELIHPENRIVVNYGPEEDIHLLGAINIRTGVSIPINELTEWKWKRADVHEFKSLDDVISAPNRSNAEGYIVHFPETDFRLKLKHEEYVSLHRDATGLSERRIWRYIKEGSYESNKELIQEEFLSFYEETGKRILSEVESMKKLYHDEYDRLESSFTGSTKLDWVNHVKDSGDPKTLSTMLSWYGKEERLFTSVTENSFWEKVKPEQIRSLWQLQSDEYFDKRNNEDE